ncbi:MAG: hypothetical protein NTX03_05650, partial [Bacteroidetes bacterium]|nr:hypothetical protein [Bacteroidota bacterium]
MKNKLNVIAIILSLFLGINAQAQIKISHYNHPAEPNTTQNGTYIKLSGGVTLPANGANVFWNYGSVKDSTASGVGIVPRTFFKATDTVFTKAGANRFYQQEVRFLTTKGILNVHESNDTNGHFYLGFNANRQAFSISKYTFWSTDSVVLLKQRVVVAQPQPIIKYPCTFQSKWSSHERLIQNYTISAKFLGYNNTPGQHIQDAYYVDSVAGYGKIVVPVQHGAFKSDSYNVILIKSVIRVIDSFYINGKPADSTLLASMGARQGMDSTFIHANFYRENYSTPLMTFVTDKKYSYPMVAYYDPDNTTYTGINQDIDLETEVSICP